MAAITDSTFAQAILDTLAVRMTLERNCIPYPMKALDYNGARIQINDPTNLGKLTVEARGGCLSNRAADPGQNLERLAVLTAFRFDDLNAPGGPKPFGYLACGFPDTLLPKGVTCASTEAQRRDPGATRAGRSTLSGSDLPQTAVDGRLRCCGNTGLFWSAPTTSR